MLDESASGVKKGSEEEVDNLNGFKGELQTTLSQLQDIENDLRHSPNCCFQGQDQGQQLWRKMPKANDVKKKRREKLGHKLNLGSCMNRCTEIMNSLLGADTAKKIKDKWGEVRRKTCKCPSYIILNQNFILRL